jgi:putative Holliday junction resolvase
MPICNVSELQSILKKGQCLLGIDHGKVVIGVAISDPGFRVASPLLSLTRKAFADDVAALATIVRERNIGGMIVGLPKNMDGSEGPAAQSARAFVRNILERSHQTDVASLAVCFWDERLSSAAIERFMVAEDMTRKRRDTVIDKAAAAYILQGALDRLHATPG